MTPVPKPTVWIRATLERESDATDLEIGATTQVTIEHVNGREMRKTMVSVRRENVTKEKPNA